MSMKKESPWDVELHLTAARGDAERLQLLLDSGRVHVDCKDKDGTTPLMLSAAGGHFASVAELLQQGADPNAKRLQKRKMTSTERTRIVLDSETKKCMTLALFNNVKNTEEMRNSLITGKIECCLLKPSLIIDELQIAVAANKAVCSAMFNELVTKTVFMETLYNLSMTKSISKALKCFGSENSDTAILAVFIHDENSEESVVMEDFLKLIQGDEISISRLAGEFSNVGEIRKIYKINDNELQLSSLANLISTRISVRDFANF
ncbi:EKC/KEOPS complex subunit TPRKB isoform X2 [Leptopilina heterotoma]|uniref:EKC/KEOPS complex subunit TPRKB isoform X2 n=1 Tax=Leptopilina heterotoma TaxID=63436 RepID=UPI001CA8D847|nr:EKC/KEOPS complex subunit TPRKB isoform X2 [Leptopilina heterotoma]